MIEALVRYFEERGFTVCVLPGRLILRKLVNGDLFGIDWAISQAELRYTRCSVDYFYQRADAYCAQVDAAVAARGGLYAPSS